MNRKRGVWVDSISAYVGAIHELPNGWDKFHICLMVGADSISAKGLFEDLANFSSLLFRLIRIERENRAKVP